MKRMIIGFFLIAGVFTAGCATTDSTYNQNRLTTQDLNKLSKKAIEAYNAEPTNSDKIVCIKEKPIGSNIPKRVCYWESQLEARRAQDQQDLKVLQNNVPK